MKLSAVVLGVTAIRTGDRQRRRHRKRQRERKRREEEDGQEETTEGEEEMGDGHEEMEDRKSQVCVFVKDTQIRSDEAPETFQIRTNRR